MQPKLNQKENNMTEENKEEPLFTTTQILNVRREGFNSLYIGGFRTSLATMTFFIDDKRIGFDLSLEQTKQLLDLAFEFLKENNDE